MPYVDPETVVSPKTSWELSKVLLNTGNGGWSAAEGKWDRRACLALRWNGSDTTEGLGNPQSRGYPTWFIVPDELETALRREIAMFEKASGFVTCKADHPEGYNDRVWRVQMTLAPQFLEKLGQSQLLFTLPEFSRWRCQPDKNYRRAGEKEALVGLFVDGEWFGDLYSYDFPPTDSQITIDIFREKLVQNVNQSIQKSGLLD